MITRTFTAATVAKAVADRTFTATITTDTIDREGDIIVADGIDITQYLRNPVVLAGHDSKAPIARCTSLMRSGRG